MSKVLVTAEYLDDIADSIRAKLQTQDRYTPAQMSGAIDQISGDVTVESLSATANGTYTAPEGTAYSPVVVNVPGGLPSATGVSF